MEPLCGILALQGDFACHARSLARLEIPFREVRKAEDLEGLTHLILPGGESTTLHRLGSVYGLLEPLAAAVRARLAVLGTCAGAILLGRGPEPPPRLGVVPAMVHRNAYGRQKDSFSAEIAVPSFGRSFHGIFIRAPRIEVMPGEADEFEVLATYGSDPVLVRYRRILLSTFHPELTDDLRIHRYFMERV